jgi:hypothetical protein
MGRETSRPEKRKMLNKKSMSPGTKIGIVLVLGIAAGLIWWFVSPTFIDKEVNEAPPVLLAEPSPTFTLVAPTEAGPAAATEIIAAATETLAPESEAEETGTDQLLRQGSFYPLAHASAGDVLIYQLADGSRILRLQDFSVDNGPDLFVYLVPVDPVPNTTGSEIAGAYNLSPLKGNIGDQNYDIPADLDLSQYKSVVIWCKAFAVPFSAAPLTSH